MRISRRAFISRSLTVLGLLAFFPTRNTKANLLTNFFGQAGQKTSPITPNSDFYITSIGVAPELNVEKWTLSLGGMVSNPLVLNYEDLKQRPQSTVIATLECIGNPLGGKDMSTAKWEGVRLKTLLDEAGVDIKGVDVVVRGADEYSDSFPLSRAVGEEVLIALNMNGVPLPVDHGFPARVIVPGLYGLKNVKWLTGLEIVDYDYKGYWQKEGWPENANVKVHSRIDLPGDRETISGQHYSIQGIAFGGENGIQSVDVTTDEGKTWNPATLHQPLSPYSWVFWSYEWSIPKVGEYTLMVSATNGKEERQERTLGKVHAITVEVNRLQSHADQ